MRATVRKWGNSLALRIPSGLAEDAHLHDGADVDIALDAGRLVIVPAAGPEVSRNATYLDALPPRAVAQVLARARALLA